MEMCAKQLEENSVSVSTADRLTMLEQRVLSIEERNSRVEAEKAWETSSARIVSIAVLTYILITFVLWLMDITHPFLNSIIPTIGFVLSTFSLPAIKRIWLQNWAGKCGRTIESCGTSGRERPSAPHS